MKNKKQNQFFNNNKKMSNINDKENYIKLMNDFYDSDLTTNDFNDDEFDDIVSDFINDLTEAGYDGNNDLNSMKWFIKGLKLPPPSIQRYDQSPEFKLNQQKGKDKLNELMNSKTPLQLDDKILNSIKNFNKNFLRPLPPKEFKRYLVTINQKNI